jgi:hypothetical protein
MPCKYIGLSLNYQQRFFLMSPPQVPIETHRLKRKASFEIASLTETQNTVFMRISRFSYARHMPYLSHPS